jgi:predicted XRE-type DNA-binding protein
MKARKRATKEHGPRTRTPASRSVFRDLFSAEEAEELEIRATLLRGLTHWLVNSNMTQTQAAETLSITQARVSDIKRGKINAFSLDLLIRLASRAGLHPRLRLAA